MKKRKKAIRMATMVVFRSAIAGVIGRILEVLARCSLWVGVV